MPAMAGALGRPGGGGGAAATNKAGSTFERPARGVSAVRCCGLRCAALRCRGSAARAELCGGRAAVGGGEKLAMWGQHAWGRRREHGRRTQAAGPEAEDEPCRSVSRTRTGAGVLECWNAGARAQSGCSCWCGCCGTASLWRRALPARWCCRVCEAGGAERAAMPRQLKLARTCCWARPSWACGSAGAAVDAGNRRESWGQERTLWAAAGRSVSDRCWVTLPERGVRHRRRSERRRAYLRRSRAGPSWTSWWRRPSGRRTSKRRNDADALSMPRMRPAKCVRGAAARA